MFMRTQENDQEQSNPWPSLQQLDTLATELSRDSYLQGSYILYTGTQGCL